MEEAAAAEGEAPRQRVVSIAGEPFEAQRHYSVALPRNLISGFCEIEPLMTFAKQHPELLPGEDAFQPALNVAVAHVDTSCAARASERSRASRTTLG